jgi:hypothetical protein
MAASISDVHIHHTPKGVRVDLGKIYVYPDGHANLTFPSTSETAELNLPLIDDLDLISELTKLLRRMNREARKPGQLPM